MAKVIIFGPAGMVGVSLVETALRGGYQVTAFIRNTPLPEHLTDKVIPSTVCWPVLDFKGVFELCTSAAEMPFCVWMLIMCAESPVLLIDTSL